MPAFIMIISMFWLKTRINLKQVTGLLITFIGVLIVISNGNLASVLRLKLNNGDLLLIVACIFYAIYAVGLRKRPEINDILLMTIFSFIAFGFSLPYFFILFMPNLLRFLPTPGTWMINFKHFLGLILHVTSSWLMKLIGITDIYI